ncbi:MAG: hypothetical protein PHD03_03020 [Bacilli bacterium]|nr:hypothetical protein [Bacilli bacterium]MDD4407082.1 hypothetical protein [Bacilli bacterium]
MNNICVKYINMINEKFSFCNPIIIIYGSNIYTANSSDLDVCLIINNNFKNHTSNIIDETILFHHENNLKLDDEVPFENKLVYSYEEIDIMLSNNPFYNNGIYYIDDIVKTKTFLLSKLMKQRLLLNILTTDHLIINDNKNIINRYENKAWDIILDTIINFYYLNNPNENEILNLLYKNKYTNAEGEMYLGYKTNNIQKELYLKNKIEEHLKRRYNR